MKRIKELDSIREMAALIIVIFHCGKRQSASLALQ